MSTFPKAWQPCRSRCLHQEKYVFSHSKRPNRAQYASVMGTPNRSSSIYPLVSLPGAGVTPYAGNSPILSYAINLKMLVGHLLRPIWIKSELATHSLNSNLIFQWVLYFTLSKVKLLSRNLLMIKCTQPGRSSLSHVSCFSSHISPRNI